VSVRALSWALREAPVASKTELLVLIVLCDHAHDDGDGAYPSVATIERMARASESGVRAALRNLERAGLIEGKPRAGRTTIYRVVMTPAAEPQPVDPLSQWTPSASGPPQPVVPTPSAIGPEPSEPSIETATQSLPVEDEIGELFAYWQRQCGHPDAKLGADRRRKIAARLREGFTAEQIRQAIDGAARGAFVNEAGRRFDDIELICRNATKLESFIGRPAATKPAKDERQERRRRQADAIRALQGGMA
jgi:hypothetical protein